MHRNLDSGRTPEEQEEGLAASKLYDESVQEECRVSEAYERAPVQQEERRQVDNIQGRLADGRCHPLLAGAYRL